MNVSPTDFAEKNEIILSLNQHRPSSELATSGIVALPEGNTAKAVILCHGFLSDKNSRTNLRLTDLLNAQNIATLRFDWVGMGESPEPFSQLRLSACAEQLDDAYHTLESKGYDQIGLIGSSFGGYMALLRAPHFPRLRALGLKCPVVDFPEVLQLEFGDEGMTHWRKHDQIPDMGEGHGPLPLAFSFFTECLHHNAYEAASHISSPTLIVHGDQDEVIPRHQIDEVLLSLQTPKQLKLIPGADHRFGQPETFRQMTNSLAQWMKEHLSTAP